MILEVGRIAGTRTASQASATASRTFAWFGTTTLEMLTTALLMRVCVGCAPDYCVVVCDVVCVL